MTGKLLTRYPLFRLLSPRQLDDWLAAGQEIDCPAGFTLFQENTPGGQHRRGLTTPRPCGVAWAYDAGTKDQPEKERESC